MKQTALVAVPLVVTLIVWAVSVPGMALQSGMGQVQLFGALALVGFGVVMILSTRLRVLDKLFGGQDKIFVVHKWMAIASIAFVVFHLAVRLSLLGTPGGGMDHGGSGMRGGMGDGTSAVHLPFSEAAATIFVVLIIIALWARTMKYETWQLIHKAMAVAYVAALIHYYTTSLLRPLAFTAFSVWMDIMAILGVAAAVYSVFLYGRLGFRHSYSVTAVTPLAADVAQIAGQSTTAPIAPHPGQFVFVKVPDRAFRSHPFTISGTPAPGQLELTVKALGDNTRSLIEVVKPGDRLLVSGPYGQFDYTRGGDNQVWVAGGIGVTPFRGFLGVPVPQRFSIDFFYGFSGADEAIYADELAAIIPNNVRLHLVDDTIDGFLTADSILKQSAVQPTDIYFAGPKAMRRALQPGFKNLGIKRFHYEQFQFR